MKMLDFIKQGTDRSVAVKKNIVGSLFVKGCSIIISLLIVPLTLGYVSSDLYGIWLTLSSIIMWLNFFDIGFTLGLKNKLTEAIALGDMQRGKVLVSTTYFMMIAIFIPLCILLEMIIPHINWASFLNVTGNYNPDIIKTLHILAACLCAQMIVNVLTAVLAAYQKVALSSAFPVIGNFISLFIILLLTKYCPPSLSLLALAVSTIPIFVIIIASFILFSSSFKAVAPSWNFVKKKQIKDLFNLGSKFFLIQAQIVVLYQCTNILISNLSGPSDVTSYNIAYKYITISMMILTIIMAPLWPAFTEAYTKNDYSWMKNVYNKMCKLWGGLTVIVILMIIVSPIVYQLWIGEKAHVPLIMTVLIGIYTIVHSWDIIQVNMINGVGAIKLQTYMTLIGLIVHIPLSLFLGRYVSCYGVIISMIVINMIYSTTFTIQIRKILNKTAKGLWLK
ncbi:MATE family efflux transporter [Bacteroides uniformis]|jgi:Na+-driven multidrug efflux pump|uniref:MATE family efflux transporter n=1 Tax=Bacteroides uniformis TaxID=820 RepID=A0AAW6GI50_BACUN|nr:oligosaccharide flippase family protein [Bacteroides uniformis]MDC1856278.1 MATE family efflux transporter [Bacteroides uniformis]MDC1860593.1 MATE family efflux transporter [Bacteroides uniformis]MDC1873369.1 MATE family efflux transporter [Bacteroides uniformis]